MAVLKKQKLSSTESKQASAFGFSGILQRPLISEKANMLSEKGTYTFFVSEEANKIMIKQAVETAFGVRVAGVRVVATPYKKVRRGRVLGRKGGMKKAFVTLQEGQKIELA